MNKLKKIHNFYKRKRNENKKTKRIRTEIKI